MARAIFCEILLLTCLTASYSVYDTSIAWNPKPSHKYYNEHFETIKNKYRKQRSKMVDLFQQTHALNKHNI